MSRNTVITIVVVILAFTCLAAGTNKAVSAKRAAAGAGPAAAGPAAVTAAPLPTGGRPTGLTSIFYKALGENCYLVFSDFGLYGGYSYTEDYGFRYNTNVYAPPEKYSGLYSWTDAPSLANYNNYVESTTTLPIWVSIPAGASSVTVQYRAKWRIEENYDGVELEIARVQTPTNWANLHPTSAVLGSGQMGQPDTNRYYYEGSVYSWKLEEADITAYKGSSVAVRFHFRSDSSNLSGRYHGIYIDDFRIIENGTTDLYSYGFEKEMPPDPWDTEVINGDPQIDKWGFSEALPADCDLLSNGELLVGAASSYVSDAFEPDWESQVPGNQSLVKYSNAGTRSSGQPEYRVEQYMYPYTDYVIVDCYVKNGKPEIVNNIYGGLIMDVDIRHDESERADDDRVTYKSADDYAMFYDDGQLDQPVCAIVYLGPNTPSSSVNFVNTVNWSSDSVNFGLMTNGQHDYNGTASAPNRWAVVLAKGPYTLSQSEVFRFSFAIVGGDNETDLAANVNDAQHYYSQLPDKTPVNVVPTSLGRVKALFH